MEPTLDQVRQELADIHDELLQLPVDAFERRSILKDRQNELRQLSARLLESHHDAETLKAAYARLQKVRDQLLDLHVSGTGFEGSFMTVVNQAIDSGMGLDAVEDRMREIIRQLRSSA